MKLFKHKLTNITIAVLVFLFIYTLLSPTVSFNTQTPKKPIIVSKEKLDKKKAEHKPQKILLGTLSSPRKLASKEALPVLEASTSNPKAYFQWVIKHGGTIVLTRGGNNNIVGLIDNNLKIVPHGSYQLPGGMARVVTNEAVNILGKTLPNNATRVLMYWPQSKQQALEDKLLSMPFHGHAQRVKATYIVKGKSLLVNIKQVKTDGTWGAIDEVISL